MPTTAQRIVYLPWTPGIQPSWTVSSVRTALREHESGSFGNSALLVDAMFRDDRLAAVVATRLNSIFGLPLSFDPVDDSAPAKAAAEECEEYWPEWAPESALREAFKWRLMMGFCIAQIIWEKGAKRWTPSIKVWHPQFIYADQDRGVYVVETTAGAVDVPLEGGDGKWLVLGTGDRPWMNGLVRPLAVPWLGAQFVFRDWLRYSERHGMPIVKAMVPAIADDIDKDEFFEDIRTLSTETTVQLPTGLDAAGASFDLELLEATANTWQGFEGALRHIHDTYAIALTGSNLTTMIEGGSFAAAKSSRAGLVRYTEADAAELSTDLRAGLLVPWAGFNFVGGDRLAPWPRWDTSPPDDLKIRAETFTALGEALRALKDGGAKVTDVAALAEEFGLHVEEKEPPAPPPPFGQPPVPPAEGDEDAPEDDDEEAGAVRLASGDNPVGARGFVQGQLYADALADAGVRQSAGLVDLEAIARVIATSEDYDDLRVRLRAAFAEMDPAPFAEVMRKALILSELAGRYGAAADE